LEFGLWRLGKDMALSLAGKNIDVVITYNTSRKMAGEVVEEIRNTGRKAESIQLNVADFNSLGSFMSNLEGLLKSGFGTEKFDFLINNAGVGATLPISQASEEEFDRMLNIHYKTVYFLTQKSLDMMNDGGCVIFISSGTTRFCVPGYSIYSSLKGAVEIFAKYVAFESGQRGILANIVAPGPVETDFNNAAIRNNPQLKEMLSARSPLGRVGYADDVGGVVAFLCSDEASWINGQRIEVSGGINL
jgi:NAD(P)-dependent dehydrogenase (short-subunit alcohol dehydrogenase family)